MRNNRLGMPLDGLINDSLDDSLRDSLWIPLRELFKGLFGNPHRGFPTAPLLALIGISLMEDLEMKIPKEYV